MTTLAPSASKTITLNIDINAPVEQVYQSFVNRDNICDWLCYDAHLHVEAGGYGLLIWVEGPHAYLEFTEVAQNQQLAFTWQDGETGTSQVDVRFEAKGDITGLTLVHSGLGDDEAVTRYTEGWKRHLNELQGILETGERRSITGRVVIGFYPVELTEEAVESLGLPVSEGALVSEVIAGYSAEAAGIQPNDVIVAVDGQAVNAQTGVTAITSTKKPGDTVEVAYYRGGEKHKVTAKLSGYPVPPVPESFDALAEERERTYADYDKRLTEAVQGISEAGADTALEPDGWNVKQTLAHVILTHRHTLEWLSTYLEGPRRINPYTNVQGRIDAIVAVHPTLDALFAELRRTFAEIVAVIRRLPKSLEARKNTLWWIVFEMQYAAFGLQTDLQRIENIKQKTA